MTNLRSSTDNAAFYGAALLGLQALDANENQPRRFGADAEACWSQFAGALGAGDRIDILLRDAAGTWGAAFSPAECFGFFGLADDEPFGPDWPSIDDASAKRLFKERGTPVTLDNVAAVLGVKGASASVPAISPSTKLVVAGGSAIVSVAKAFSENGTLSWTDQVVVLANEPAWRQLAGLAAVVLGARGRTIIVRPDDGAEAAVRAAGFAHIDATVVSPDAAPEAADLARKLSRK